jgi:transposase
VDDGTTTRPEVPLAPAPVGTINIALSNGRRMTIPVSLAPSHLAALLAVLDPR